MPPPRLVCRPAALTPASPFLFLLLFCALPSRQMISDLTQGHPRSTLRYCPLPRCCSTHFPPNRSTPTCLSDGCFWSCRLAGTAAGHALLLLPSCCHRRVAPPCYSPPARRRRSCCRPRHRRLHPRSCCCRPHHHILALAAAALILCAVAPAAAVCRRHRCRRRPLPPPSPPSLHAERCNPPRRVPNDRTAKREVRWPGRVRQQTGDIADRTARPVASDW